MFKAVIILAIVAIFLLLALLGRGLVLMRRNSEYPGPVGCWICGATDGKHDQYCSRPDGDV